MGEEPSRADERGTDSTPAAAPELTSDDLYRALSETRRRRSLVYLFGGDDWTVADLASALVGWAVTEDGGVGTSDDRERLRALLVHVDLPLLSEAGLVEYDRDAGVVRTAAVDPAIEHLVRRSVGRSAPSDR
ncbi:DUF7344 domain-containing protein [Halobaculum lipolyticum]|uniref:ArsR family transcriptional regulator n=1 Tax=Halobaculum lipolyticum TaxID=3032001 RepID=A0ABD5WAJ7_9EURY|nr:ArsR family transcriptional regulator [Halobaculum sp. DT31]